jgi:ribosomal protein S18 acetylase RimI-like enzyme
MHFDDPPNAGIPASADQDRAEAASTATASLARQVVLPRLLRAAVEERWWSPTATRTALTSPDETDATIPALEPTIVPDLTAEVLERLTLAPRVVAPTDPAEAQALLVAAARDGARVIGAVAGSTLVGAAVLWPARPHPSDVIPPWEVLALGVAPAFREGGLATALLAAAMTAVEGDPVTAAVGVAERDPIEPLPVEARSTIARRLFERAGFRVRSADGAVGQTDPAAIMARHG